jgi:hypothetical protein
MERRRLLRVAASGRATAVESRRAARVYGSDGVVIELFRLPYGELQAPSER